MPPEEASSRSTTQAIAATSEPTTTSATTEATLCNPQPSTDGTSTGGCPETPTYSYPPPVVHNGQEAAEYVLKNKFNNDPDIVTIVWSETYTPSGYPSQFIIKLVSKSIRQSGGTGTLEFDMVTPEGLITVMDPSLVPAKE